MVLYDVFQQTDQDADTVEEPAGVDKPDDPEASSMTCPGVATTSEFHRTAADVDTPDDPEASNMTYVVESTVSQTVQDAADASDTFISELDDSLADEDYVQPSDCSTETDTESCNFFLATSHTA